MICDNCGHINPNINKRCDKCGKELEPAPRYPTERNKSTNRSYEKNEGLFDDIKNLSTEKKIIGVCCFILLLIFAVSSVLPYNNDSNIIPYDNNTTDYVTDVNNTPEVVQTPVKANTKINVTAKSPVKSGESTIINGYLLDESANPLYNCDVIVKIANNEFNIKTKHDGSYIFEYNDTENGSQNVSVIFEENADYYGCQNSTFFEVVNNTTDDKNDTANGTDNHTISANNTQNNSKNMSDDEHDNHDTHNSILSWLFGNSKRNNLTNSNSSDNTTTHNSSDNTTTHNSSQNNQRNNTQDNDIEKNNDTANANNTTDNNDTSNTTNTTHQDNKTNNTTDDKNDTINNTTDNYNNTTENKLNNNTTADDKKEDNHHHPENNTTQTRNDTNKSDDNKTGQEKSDTKLDVKVDKNITENEPTIINGTLLDENNTPVANAVIKIKIDGKETIAHTNGQGEYSIEYTPTDAQTKHIEVIYEGDDRYSGTHKTSTLSIK